MAEAAEKSAGLAAAALATPCDATPAAPVPRRRAALVYALLLVIAAGSLYDLVTGGDHWPFSSYGMYAVARTRRVLITLRLYGVTAGTSGREIPLTDPEYLEPFDSARLTGSLGQIMRLHQPARLQRALTDCLDRYERRRRSGHHHGPALGGMRLYAVQWTLDPWARNVDHPDQRKRLSEVMRR